MLTFALAKKSNYTVLNLLLYFYVSVGLIFPEYKGGSQKQKNLVNELYFILAIMGEENFKEFKQHVHRAQYSIGQKGSDVSESGLFLLVKIGVFNTRLHSQSPKSTIVPPYSILSTGFGHV